MLIDVNKDSMERIASVVASLKLQPGRGMGKLKTDLSGEAVWDLVAGDGATLLLKTSLVAKRFAINLLYQGKPMNKPKLDFIIDKQLPNADKLQETLRLIADKWRALAMVSIPAEHTGEWADEVRAARAGARGRAGARSLLLFLLFLLFFDFLKPPQANRVSKAFLGAPSGKPGPKLLVPGKAKPDGSGFYDPTLSGVAIKTKAPSPEAAPFTIDESLIKFPNESSASRADFLRVLKENLPCSIWDVSVSGAGGKPLAASVLLNAPLTGNAVIEFSSSMLKPTSTLSLHFFLRAFRLSDVDAKRKFDEIALEAALWDDDEPAPPAKKDKAEDGAAGSEPEDYY